MITIKTESTYTECMKEVDRLRERFYEIIGDISGIKDPAKQVDVIDSARIVEDSLTRIELILKESYLK